MVKARGWGYNARKETLMGRHEGSDSLVCGM
jgi:hypothetical protein